MFVELCEEIDYWRDRALKAERREKELQAQYSETLAADIKHGEQMMGLLLTATLNGNLVPVPESQQIVRLPEQELA